jgi:hypothetical protein
VQWVTNKLLLLLLLTIISVCLKSKSSLQKEIYGDFEKKPETPPKWRQIKTKSAKLESELLKTSCRAITVPLLEQQGKSLFCIGSTDLSPFSLFFFLSRPSGSPEHHREMLNSSFKSYFLYLRAFYKLRHLQVPHVTKMALSAISQVVALAGYKNIEDRFFIAHIKDIALIYVLFINSTV